jgi:hypothetical protein
MRIPFEYYFIALSMLVGFATQLGRPTALYQRMFPFFLLIALCTEITAWRLSVNSLPNAALYNFFSVAAFLFYMSVIMQEVFALKAKRAIKYVMIIYTIISLINILFIQKIHIFHTMTFSIGCLVIVVTCLYYFYELFQVPRSIDLKKEPAFWIVSGLVFYYLCTLPILGALNYLYTFPDVISASIEQIITILNVLLYSLFTIAFLCRISFRRSTSSLS